MSLSSISISTFRNIESAFLELSPSINLIAGENGSGKSSVLEAIYFLSTARSFRTSKLDHLIQFQKDALMLVAKLNSENSGVIPLGIQKSSGKDKALEVRLNGKRVDKVSSLASVLPIQVVTPESYKLFFDGPSERRKYLDLGLFHVEQSFHNTWIGYSRALKQRNALLRSKNPDRGYYQVWDDQLDVLASVLTELRQDYVAQLQQALNKKLAILLPQWQIELSYACGWNPKQGRLKDVLKNAFERDFKAGFTQYGSHRFDLKISVDQRPAELILSRGQLKLLLFALKIAQSELIGESKKNQGMFLVDDLPSELDEDNKEKLAEIFETCAFQFVISGIESKNLHTFASKNFKMFHVKHGKIN